MVLSGYYLISGAQGESPGSEERSSTERRGGRPGDGRFKVPMTSRTFIGVYRYEGSGT